MACICRTRTCPQGDGPVLRMPVAGGPPVAASPSAATTAAPAGGGSGAPPHTALALVHRGQTGDDALQLLQRTSAPFAGAVEIFTVAPCSDHERQCGTTAQPDQFKAQTTVLGNEARNYFYPSGVALASYVLGRTSEVARVTPLPVWEHHLFNPNPGGNAWGDAPYRAIIGTLRHRTDAAKLTAMIFLCHGDWNGTMLGVSLGHAQELAAEVARHADFSQPFRVAFLACLTGRGAPHDQPDPRGTGSLAEKVCGELIDAAVGAGVTDPKIQVDGHYVAGAATTLANVRRFYSIGMHRHFVESLRATPGAIRDPAPSDTPPSHYPLVLRTDLAMDAPGHGFTAAFRQFYGANAYWKHAVYNSIEKVWSDTYAAAPAALAASKPSWMTAQPGDD